MVDIQVPFITGKSYPTRYQKKPHEMFKENWRQFKRPKSDYVLIDPDEWAGDEGFHGVVQESLVSLDTFDEINIWDDFDSHWWELCKQGVMRISQARIIDQSYTHKPIEQIFGVFFIYLLVRLIKSILKTQSRKMARQVMNRRQANEKIDSQLHNDQLQEPVQRVQAHVQPTEENNGMAQPIERLSISDRAQQQQQNQSEGNSENQSIYDASQEEQEEQVNPQSEEVNSDSENDEKQEIKQFEWNMLNYLSVIQRGIPWIIELDNLYYANRQKVDNPYKRRTDINQKMRKKLIDWVFALGAVTKICVKCANVTVQIVDYMIIHFPHKFSISNFQLLRIASFYAATEFLNQKVRGGLVLC